ncbi:MAG: type II toxin-antitoxin system HicA family toxin [Polyangiales bacterium]
MREFIAALERDGFAFGRGHGGHLQYRDRDGRQITVSFHRSGATFRRGTLLSMLRATRWTDADLRRLGLTSTPPEARA